MELTPELASSQDAQVRVRVPEPLLGHLKKAARMNGRTLNAECLFRFYESVNRELAEQGGNSQ